MQRVRSYARTLFKTDPSPSAEPQDDNTYLYLALYARMKDPNTYHYTLHLSPKYNTKPKYNLGPQSETNLNCSSTKHHCVNALSAAPPHNTSTITWVYDCGPIDPDTEPRILVRILIAKVLDVDRMKEVFRQAEVVKDGSNGFRCGTWIENVMSHLETDSKVRKEGQGILGEGRNSSCEEIQKTALEFVEKKKEERRFDVGWKGQREKVATFDMLLGREVVP